MKPIARAFELSQESFDELVVIARNSDKFPSNIIWLNGEPIINFPGAGMISGSMAFPMVWGPNSIKIVADKGALNKNVLSDLSLRLVSSGTTTPLLLVPGDDASTATSSFNVVRARGLPASIKPGKVTSLSDQKLKNWTLLLCQRLENKEISLVRGMVKIGNDLPDDVIWPMLKPEFKLKERVTIIEDVECSYGNSMVLIYRKIPKAQGVRTTSLCSFESSNGELELSSFIFLVDDKGNFHLLGADHEFHPINLEK